MMVSEMEYDKNQMQRPASVHDIPLLGDILEPNIDLSKPLFPQAIAAGAVMAGGGPGLQTGGPTGTAAKTVYERLLKAGLTKEAAKSGGMQAAAIMREMEVRGSVDIAKAVDRATFLGAQRGGLDSKTASAIAIKAAKSLSAPAAAQPQNVAEIGAKFSSFGATLSKFKGTAGGIAIGALFTPLTMLFHDYLKGTLDLNDARGQAAINFYKEGLLTDEEFSKELDQLGFDEAITKAYAASGAMEKNKVDIYGEIGQMIGKSQFAGESRTDYSNRIFSFMKQEEDKATANLQKAQETAAQTEQATVQRSAELRAAQSGPETRTANEILLNLKPAPEATAEQFQLENIRREASRQRGDLPPINPDEELLKRQAIRQPPMPEPDQLAAIGAPTQPQLPAEPFVPTHEQLQQFPI